VRIPLIERMISCIKLIDITRAAMGQFPFGQRPDPFIGIEFRSVRGKMLDVETWVLPQEPLQRFSPGE